MANPRDSPEEAKAAHDFLQKWLCLSRVAPTLLIFHCIWEAVFPAMRREFGEEREATLRRYYFIKLDATDARSQYRIESWPSDQTFVHYAAWWCGPERIQPGSASGGQAQEAWHGNLLKPWMPSLRLRMPDFVTNLSGFTKARRGQLIGNDVVLPDYPSEPWPDRFLLEASNALLAEVRNPASEFKKHGSFDVHRSDDGSLFYAMRHHLLRWDQAGACWSPDPAPRAVPPGTAKALAELMLARTAEHFATALGSLTSRPPRCTRAACAHRHSNTNASFCIEA